MLCTSYLYSIFLTGDRRQLTCDGPVINNQSVRVQETISGGDIYDWQILTPVIVFKWLLCQMAFSFSKMLIGHQNDNYPFLSC